VKKFTPQDIYQEALKERANPDPLKKRQACEKGWLAVTEAVNQFLVTKGMFVPIGTGREHVERGNFLDTLALTDPAMQLLDEKVSIVADQLHGRCFYGNDTNPHFDTVLKKTVREILELTGFGDNGQEEE